jgi:chromosome segregation ATPase
MFGDKFKELAKKVGEATSSGKDEELQKVRNEKAAMEEQFKGLVEDFTQMNVNLNEYKGKVYDLEKNQKMYQKQVKELQTQVNTAEKDLRKKNMTIKKSKEKGALESLMEENDNQREQILVLKNSLRSLHEAQQVAKEEAAETAERGGAQGNEDDGDSQAVLDDPLSHPLAPLDEASSASSEKAEQVKLTESPTASPSASTRKVARRPSVSDQMAVKQQEELISLNKQVDELKSKIERDKVAHYEDLQRMVEKSTQKEEEIQKLKTGLKGENDKLSSSQKKISEMGKKLELMVNAYQTLKKSNDTVVKKMSELEAANQKLEELSADKNEEGIKAVEQKHQEALKKAEMESKGALDGARARREAEVQGYQERLARATEKSEKLEKDIVETTSEKKALQEEIALLQKSKDENDDRLQQTKKELQAQRVRATEAEVKLTETNELLEGRVTEVQDVMRQLEEGGKERLAIEETLQSVREDVEQLKEGKKNAEQKLVDQSIEHKIAGKRQVQMIKDLKTVLKQEAQRRELAEGKLKSTTSVLEKLQEEMASAPVMPPPAPAPTPKEGGILSPGRRKSLSALVGAVSGGGGGSSNDTVSSGSTQKGRSASVADDDGVKKALAKRLESLLEENVMIKEKVSMLEGIVQELTDELNIAKSINTAVESATKKDEAEGAPEENNEDPLGEDDQMESFDICALATCPLVNKPSHLAVI